MLVNMISWCLFGLIAGAMARFLVPGKDPMGCFATIGLGVLGSFVFGAITHLLFAADNQGIEPAGWIGSILGAVIVLLVYRKIAKRPRPSSSWSRKTDVRT